MPHAEPTGRLRDDLLAHLDALRRALVEGHLGLVGCALGERTAVDPAFAPLHAELTEAGCASLRALLADAVARAELPAALDVPAALAALEGPVFHPALVRREPLEAAALPGIVDAVLAVPPLVPRARSAPSDVTS